MCPPTGLPKTATSDEPGVELGDLPGGQGAGVAQAMDGRVVRVRMPASTDARVLQMTLRRLRMTLPG